MRGASRARWRLLLAALAVLPAVHAACSFSLSLSAAEADAGVAGWCPPYAATGSGAAATRCSGVTVPGGAVLAFGTCAMPGAACTGATRLELWDVTPPEPDSLVDNTLVPEPVAVVSRVELSSGAAAVALGCVLGAHCSYGEWRNPSLAPAAVEVAQGCAGKAACAGVVAWSVLASNASSLPPPPPATTPGLAFSITPSRAVTITGLAGAARDGSPVTVWGRANRSPFTYNALSNSSRWTKLFDGAWSAGAGVAFTTPLVVPAGNVSGLVVLSPTAEAPLACAHTLDAHGVALLADEALSVSQARALTVFNATGLTERACAWAGLTLRYATAAPCAPPPAPPTPDVPLYTTMLVLSLGDLLRALAEPSVTAIVVDAHIVLNGTELTAALGVNGTRRLVVEGSNACHRLPPGSPLCSISAAGLSRVFRVTEGVSLSLGHLLLRDGRAPAAGFGGCVLADCAGCALEMDDVRVTACAAPGGGGGGVAVLGGGTLRAVELEVEGSSAAVGAGLLAVGCASLLLNRSSFHDNVARGAAHDMEMAASALGDARGAGGGGVALLRVVGAVVAGCSFARNTASTEGVVLVSNPGVEQARGGGLLVLGSRVAVSGCAFDANTASYGGGVYVEGSAASLSACSLTGNLATLGDGGGLFAKDCDGTVRVWDSVVSGNAAGGHAGGGLAVMNASLTLSRSLLAANSASDGCGGAVGLDVGASLLVQGGSVVDGNVARRGGGLCCIQCADMRITDSFLRNNAATAAGGAIHASWTPVTVLNTSLARNVAPEGGAVAAVSAGLTVSDCALTNNRATATHGGAIFHDATDEGAEELTVTRSTLANNTASAAGGACAAFASAAAIFTQCSFTNNSITAAAPTGGALMSLNVARLVLANCTFSANWLKKVSELAVSARLGYVGSVAAPGSGSGGAVWVGSDGAVSVDVLGCTFLRNWGATGGCLYITGAVRFTMRWSALTDCHAYGESSEGGGLVTDMEAVSQVFDSAFTSCEAVRGGAGWHGAASATNYTRTVWEANEGKPGDDTKGSALYVGDGTSSVSVALSTFRNNMGERLCGGTVAMSRSEGTRLDVSDSLFVGNTAHLGGAFHIAAYNEATQFGVSGSTFRDNRAYIGGVLFSEADTLSDVDCAPLPCSESGNEATDYGMGRATPAKHINIAAPLAVRSGAPLPITVTLTDGFDQLLNEWEDLVVTITGEGALSGLTRVFYAAGAAVFSSLSLKGNEATSYTLEVTVYGPNLFGNDENERSTPLTISVKPCEVGETFDAETMDCACADGYGLVVDDHTCRACVASEVVPPDGLSCVACPALSAPVGARQCACIPGYFGTLFGATGACTQCPADTYRSAGDPPETCRPCPVTSHTFALGATSEKDCLCAINTFNDLSAVNASFACAAVPEGGWAPQADSRLFALEDYWRPGPNSSRFFRCSTGMCLREEPVSAAQLGYKCREGHVGHLCAVCDTGYALQGIHCGQCAPGQRFEEWSAARRGGLIFIGLFLLFAAMFFLFFLPLCPRCEAALEAALQPAVEHMERALGNMTAGTRAASRPPTADTRPGSANRRPGSRGRPPPPPPPVAAATEEDNASALPPARSSRLSAGASILHRRRSLSISVPVASCGKRSDGEDGADEMEMETRVVTVERPSRVSVFFDLIGEPIRVVVSFWQVVSSFSSTMYVPWPSVYYALARSLNVTSLQFLRLPAISCISPGVSFLTVFNGTTISTLLFVVFCALVYELGQRTAVARADDDRRRRFKTRVLSVFIWGVFFVYPQVSSTTLLIFACTPLEDSTSWLMADMRIQCWTPSHRLYVGVGIVWTLLFPIGIPIAFVVTLYRAKVPHLAGWKRDCAWLRSIVQRAILMGVQVPGVVDSDNLTTESVTVEGLQVLHKLFVGSQVTLGPPQQTQTQTLLGTRRAVNRTGSTLSVSADGLTVRQLLNAVHASAGPAQEPAQHDAGRAGVEVERRPRLLSMPRHSIALEVPQQSHHALSSLSGATRSTFSRHASTASLHRSAAALPANAWLAALLRGWWRLAELVHLRARSLRRVLTIILYGSEHDLLLGGLLEWARHDKQSLVSEPRSNLMRWRTQYEWQALRAGGVPLSEHDITERAAYFKYQFLFSSYSVHAWYWESIDLFQKLFLTSLIAFVAPHTAVQVIVACLFSFVLVLFTIQIKPYRERANNQLVALAQINIFLFLFTGLLLQTNPDGVSNDRMLFSVVVGMLTTSIVAFMFYLFLRELFWQLMAALHEVDEEDAAEEAEWALADEAAALAEARAEGRLSPLQSGDGGDISCGDEDDDAGVWRSPPVGEEDEPRCGTLQRACWALAACLALGLGLGLGLRHDVAAPPVTPHGLPVARFTLVIGRGPTLADSGKYGITVNGSSPGPTLRMPLGSRAEVMVINELGDDVTAVHWHGLSQRGSPFADGALGVTQCGVPFAPAGANHMLYAFTPNRAGTFWYHGHYGGQYPDGLYGALVVDDGGAAIAAAAVAAAAAAANGTAAAAPSGAVALAVNASASYDADSWVWLAADWHDAPVMSLLPGYLSGESGGGYEPMPDAIIVSGARSGAAGAAYSTARTARQLVRVVNTGTLSMWRVSVDGMPLTLVELDGTACAPLDVAALELNVAQRAAFVLDWARLHADVAASPAIWFHIDAMPAMYRSYAADAPDAGLYGSSSGQPFDTTWRGVIRFEEDMRRLGAAVLPNYTLAPELNLPSRVDTPNLFAARSWPLAPAPAPTHDIYLEVSVSFDENGVRRALMNGATALMDATAGVTVPELYAYTSAAGGPLSDEDAPLGGRIHGSGAVPFVLPLDAVVDVLINNTDAAEHPFHLHGHTFWAVASSAAPGAGAAYAPHYVRRDVVSVPAFGWARIRFAVDNPGVWLMHCHVEWHMHAGMSATFVEAPSELADGGASGRFVTPPTHAAACALAAGMPPH